MKKNCFLTVVLTLCVLIKLPALGGPFENGGYIGDLGWTYKNGGAVFNGKRFYSVAESYREQSGTVVFGGEIITQVWLYDTYTYHNGYGADIYYKYLPEFYDSCKMYIVWGEEIKNTVPENIKALMKERNCDVAIYYAAFWFWVANYDKDKNLYWVTPFQVYPKN